MKSERRWHKIGVIHGDFCYAGRTDRGVSALGQVIDFWIDEDKEKLTRPRCVNGRLPRDIWTWAWARAPIGFSARWNAQWREYRYLLWHPGLDTGDDALRCCAPIGRARFPELLLCQGGDGKDGAEAGDL